MKKVFLVFWAEGAGKWRAGGGLVAGDGGDGGGGEKWTGPVRFMNPIRKSQFFCIQIRSFTPSIIFWGLGGS